MPRTTIDLSALPEEVTDYGFDQLPDRLNTETLHAAVERVLAEGYVEWDYDDQTLEIRRDVVETVLYDAIEAKINDIEWEVRHGERDDYTVGDCVAFRQALDDAAE